MAEHCKNCGLELFTAQRFCRACGAPTEQLSEEQVPTRIMTPPSDGYGARGAATAPTPRSDTSPVYEPPPMGYQPNVPPMYPSVMPPYTPPRKRSPVGWILAFIGMGLFALVVVAVMMMARFKGRSNDQAGSGSGQSARSGERAIDESTADTVVIQGNETTLTKTFQLAPEARVVLKNVNGNITVTAWDQPKAEVRIIRKDRNSQVFANNNGGNLSIRTATTRGNQDVRFELLLPRELARLELNSTNGIIKVSDVTAEIVVDATNGAIDLTDVAGVSRVNTVNGSIKATVLETSDRPMELKSVNGTIDLTMPAGFDAILDASTVHGTINVDDSLGIQVERGRVGQKAQGEIGLGGERLRLDTVNGSIKLTTAEPRTTTRATKGREGER